MVPGDNIFDDAIEAWLLRGRTVALLYCAKLDPLFEEIFVFVIGLS